MDVLGVTEKRKPGRTSRVRFRPVMNAQNTADNILIFRQTLATGGVKCLPLPPRSPNLNAFAERWVRSVKSECLSHLRSAGKLTLFMQPGEVRGYLFQPPSPLIWRIPLF